MDFTKLFERHLKGRFHKSNTHLNRDSRAARALRQSVDRRLKRDEVTNSKRGIGKVQEEEKRKRTQMKSEIPLTTRQRSEEQQPNSNKHRPIGDSQQAHDNRRKEKLMKWKQQKAELKKAEVQQKGKKPAFKAGGAVHYDPAPALPSWKDTTLYQTRTRSAATKPPDVVPQPRAACLAVPTKVEAPSQYGTRGYMTRQRANERQKQESTSVAVVSKPPQTRAAKAASSATLAPPSKQKGKKDNKIKAPSTRSTKRESFAPPDFQFEPPGGIQPLLFKQPPRKAAAEFMSKLCFPQPSASKGKVSAKQEPLLPAAVTGDLPPVTTKSTGLDDHSGVSKTEVEDSDTNKNCNTGATEEEVSSILQTAVAENSATIETNPNRRRSMRRRIVSTSSGDGLPKPDKSQSCEIVEDSTNTNFNITEISHVQNSANQGQVPPAAVTGDLLSVKMTRSTGLDDHTAVSKAEVANTADNTNSNKNCNTSDTQDEVSGILQRAVGGNAATVETNMNRRRSVRRSILSSLSASSDDGLPTSDQSQSCDVVEESKNTHFNIKVNSHVQSSESELGAKFSNLKIKSSSEGSSEPVGKASLVKRKSLSRRRSRPLDVDSSELDEVKEHSSKSKRRSMRRIILENSVNYGKGEKVSVADILENHEETISPLIKRVSPICVASRRRSRRLSRQKTKVDLKNGILTETTVLGALSSESSIPTSSETDLDETLPTLQSRRSRRTSSRVISTSGEASKLAFDQAPACSTSEGLSTGRNSFMDEEVLKQLKESPNITTKRGGYKSHKSSSPSFSFKIPEDETDFDDDDEEFYNPIAEDLRASFIAEDLALQRKLELDSRTNDGVNFADYFRILLQCEVETLSQLSDEWESKLFESELPPDASGDIQSAIGKARLLMSSKFLQFSKLIDTSEDQDDKARPTATDLQGFWDMVLIQVSDVKKKFAELEEKKAKGWIQEEEMIVPPLPKKLKTRIVKKPPKVLGVRSNIRAHILAARKNLVVSKDDDSVKLFDGGFFKVASPSPSAIKGRTSSTGKKRLSSRRHSRNSRGSRSILTPRNTNVCTPILTATQKAKKVLEDVTDLTPTCKSTPLRTSGATQPVLFEDEDNGSDGENRENTENVAPYPSPIPTPVIPLTPILKTYSHGCTPSRYQSPINVQGGLDPFDSLLCTPKTEKPLEMHHEALTSGKRRVHFAETVEVQDVLRKEKHQATPHTRRCNLRTSSDRISLLPGLGIPLSPVPTVKEGDDLISWGTPTGNI